MQNFLKKHIGTPTELTLALSGQLWKIAGIIEDLQDNIALLKTEESLLAVDIHNLLSAKLLSQPKNSNTSTPSPPTESSAPFAPSLNMPMSNMQTIL